MDERKFDRVARRLAASLSRRRAIRALAGMAGVGGVADARSGAAARRKGRCRSGKVRCGRRCLPGTCCPGATCNSSVRCHCFKTVKGKTFCVADALVDCKPCAADTECAPGSRCALVDFCDGMPSICLPPCQA